MRTTDAIADELFNKIRNRFENVSIGDKQANSTMNPEEARFFNFDFVASDGQNFGNVTISIIDANSVKIYYSRNMTNDLQEQEKKEWYDFLRNIRLFAKRNMLSFDARDISKDNLNHKDLKHAAVHQGVLSSDDITESKLYGTRTASYQNLGPCRIVVKHTGIVDEERRGSRSRNIDSIFIETADGERFKLPFKKLAGARAMAKHLANGGTTHDRFAEHVGNIVKEMDDMKTFVRSMRNKTFEDVETSDMVDTACERYSYLKNLLHSMAGPKGYQEAYNSLSENSDIEDSITDEDLDQMKDRFMRKIYDDRLTSALPHVMKAYHNRKGHDQSIQDEVAKFIESADSMITNPDEVYESMMNATPDDIVPRILETISRWSSVSPSVVEFAQRWANRYSVISEDSSEEVVSEKALAVKLATKFLKEFNAMKRSVSFKANAPKAPKLDHMVGAFEDWMQVDEDAIFEQPGPSVRPESDQQIEKLAKIMSNPLAAGPDGTNASTALKGIIEDDELSSKFANVAKDFPDTDVRSIILSWLNEYEPHAAHRIADMKAGAETQKAASGVGQEAPPPAPEAPAPEQGEEAPEAPEAPPQEEPNKDITGGEDISDIEDLQKLSGLK